MNENPPPTEESPKPNRAPLVFIGFLVGIAPALTLMAQPKGPVVQAILSRCLWLWPLSAIFLVIIPQTRRIGLGMLLGIGLSLLTVVAICFGSLSHI